MRPLVALVCAVLLVGCGDSKPKSSPTPAPTEAATATPTEATPTPVATAAPKSVAKQANAICRSYTAKGRALGSPDLTDPAAAEKYFSAAEKLAQGQLAELSALEAPADEQADLTALNSAFKDATKLLGDLAKAASDRDKARGAELVQQLTPISDRVDKAARALGATACAS
ncbi:MAG: hypothetical protein QOF76_4373 [Solirubrobacteraceae bacterium]|nr:hypothetical protein [Solirubrobacteraceae bacterium]